MVDKKLTDNELTEKELQHQIEMHKILMNISANCINVPLDMVGEAIQSALKEIGEFVSADRTYIFDYDFEKNIAVNTYEWCNDGVEPQIENLQNSPLEDSPDWIEPHLKGETLIIPDVSALPSGATRDIFEQQKIKSLIAVPLFHEDQLIGFTGFDSVKKFHTHSVKEIELFEFFAQILINFKMNIRAEKALRESEEKYRSMMESMKDAAWITSTDFRIAYMNPEMISRIGYNATGQFCHNALYGSDEKCSWCVFDQIWKGEHVEYEWANPKDNRIYHITNSPINHSNGHISKLSIFRNITKNKEMEVQSHQAQKMESIGTLAGGIAHDFNNLLYVVMGNIALVQDDLNPEMEAYKNLKHAQKACIKAKKLSGQLITFSKGGNPVKEVTSINKMLKNAVLSAWQGSDIKPEFLIPDDIRKVDIDKTQIKQAINNIVVNAKEAMEDKGQLKVSCENIDIAEEGFMTLNQGKYIKISFEDQGCGIPEENLKKIFDPYFSTKEMWTNKGKGLGLSVSYSIIKKHAGLITAESELETGSTFSVYLPVAAYIKKPGLQRPEKKLVEPALVKQLDSDKRKILLMDDEEAIRDFLGQMIKRLGYDVETCIEGREAVEIYKNAFKSNEPFDLVILDLTNKFGMGGQETMKRLLEIDHNTKGIIITGYSDNPVVTDFKKYGFSGFLTKPATKGELSKIINDVTSRDL